MSFFKPLIEKINLWANASASKLTLGGISSDQWGFINYLHKNKDLGLLAKNQLLLFNTNEEAEAFYHRVKSIYQNDTLFLHYPGLDASPYSSLVSSERNLLFRFRVLDTIANTNKNFFLITSIEALSLRVPSKNFFSNNSLILNEEDIISPDELSGKLVSLGYTHSHTVDEPGTFCKKGELFDIYPISSPPARIHYFDDLIEEMFYINKETQKTIKDNKIMSLRIVAAPGIFCNSTFSNNLRANALRPTPAQKDRFAKRKYIFELLSNGSLFDNYPVYTPLFLDESKTLYDFLNFNETNLVIFDEHEVETSFIELIETLRTDYEESLEDSTSEDLLPEYSKLYDIETFNKVNELKRLLINHVQIHTSLNDEDEVVDVHLENTRHYFSKHFNLPNQKHELLKETLSFIQKEFKHSGDIIFTVQNKNSKDEIIHILDVLNFDSKILERTHFIDYKLDAGFYYENSKTLVISDSDLFAVKRDKVKVNKTQDYDLFAEQLASLKENDFVIHSKHGVGKYLGLETMDIGGSQTDYLVLIFKGNDKVFVPIYKMNLIQKYADSTANVQVDNLRTNKFSNTKSKAKESAKKLAFDLLKLQAERQSSPAFAFSEPEHEFTEFELDFPFNETPDQRTAIDLVLEKMQKPTPMDFLVCGDVGFGKTEIAMRAAFKAVLDNKQVAVLVPTTVLALQHYNSFVKRFKNFPVNIDFLSRFKTGKDEKDTKERIEKGEVDIIVGTHKLLSKTIKFKDLGLVIVDEEQRFGVGHKNKLKLLKSTVDFLTLTATPIPRTLQLSFLGLKDLALIKTAPPRRQSIKTYLIKEDDHTLQSAIQRELRRGGQVFIVHNRVQDMENYVAYIRELVPEAKIVYAHGQMSEKELESRVSAFYKGAYQILVSTTIIESGIDIPNANTMIVDRADRYGLAQLHQLRGRIGRSDKKAYAYFVIPKNRVVSEVAAKRLKALQTYADMGSGFQIANCDLEIRGAGDILGAQQSGHIEAVGLELYMELLTDAINELRGEKKIIKKDIEINAPFASFIPSNYISDASDRLKYYKQLSNAIDIEKIDNLKEKIFDIYGPFPEEFENLFAILTSRTYLMPYGIKAVHIVDTNLLINFDKDQLDNNEELRNRIVDTFLKNVDRFQFTPDFKLVVRNRKTLSPSKLVELSKEIAGLIG